MQPAGPALYLWPGDGVADVTHSATEDTRPALPGWQQRFRVLQAQRAELQAEGGGRPAHLRYSVDGNSMQSKYLPGFAGLRAGPDCWPPVCRRARPRPHPGSPGGHRARYLAGGPPRSTPPSGTKRAGPGSEHPPPAQPVQQGTARHQHYSVVYYGTSSRISKATAGRRACRRERPMLYSTCSPTQ